MNAPDIKASIHRCAVCLPMIVSVTVALFLIGLPLARQYERAPSGDISSLTGFSLSPVMPNEAGFSDVDLNGGLSVVNVWSTWCSECRSEHAVLLELAKRGIVPVYGLNYRDDPARARAWLAGNGNPFQRAGADRDGKVAAAWGVYGVPETLLVGPNGNIIHRHPGVLTAKTFDEHFLPIIQKVAAR